MAVVIDSSKPWRLSYILEGHTSDVKGVYASVVDDSVELIHSASRDETGRSWYREGFNHFQRGASYQGHRFQNAVVHVGASSGSSSGEFELPRQEDILYKLRRNGIRYNDSWWTRRSDSGI